MTSEATTTTDDAKPDRSDPRLGDETQLQRIRRRVDEVAGDAPELAKIALEAIVKKHNPDLKGSASLAGRVGLRSGKVSELTAVVKLKPGGAERLGKILALTGGNMDGAEQVSTLHDMRFAFLDDNERILFATAYDGDWDSYIDDFATKIPDLMELLFGNIEGWPGIADPSVKDFIAGAQITAAGWFVANPQVTVVDVRRFQRTQHALDAFLDSMSSAKDLDATTAAALKKLTDVINTPDAVDY